MKRALAIGTVLFIILFAFIGCSKDSNNENNNSSNNNNEEKNDQEIVAEDQPIVTITMEDGSEIKIELYPEIAPNTVNNFIFLIEEDYYDGVIFHRVIPGFMIQGGDPRGDGTGGPGYSIQGEFASNGIPNTLKHERGVISMARTNDPDSAGSQFFIMHQDAPHLDGDYAAFGKVIEGMEVVDGIASVKTDAQDKPEENQTMKKVTVDLGNYKQEDPDIIQ